MKPDGMRDRQPVREPAEPAAGRWQHPGRAAHSGQERSSVLGDLGALLRHRHFRALFLAHFVSNLGDWLAFMALFSLAAMQWHAGVLGVSFLAIAYTVPMVIVAPLAGVFVDRWKLRRVLVWSDLLRAVLVLLMALRGNLVELCALLFLHQTVSSFFNPARVAAVPHLVERERLLAANALTTQAGHLTRVLGPGVAGMLVAALGPRSCFFADAVSFGLSAALLATLPRLAPAKRDGRSASTVWRDLAEAARFLYHEKRLRRTVIMVALTMMSLGAFLAVVAVYARDQLGAGSRSMGLLVSTIGIGTVAAAPLVIHAGKRWGKMRTMGAGMMLLAAALVGLSQSHAVAQALVSAALLGAGAAAVLVPAQSLVQEETPHAILARVQSSATALISLAQVTSMGLAGPAARFFGLAELLGGAAAMLVTTGLLHLALGLRERLRHHAS